MPGMVFGTSFLNIGAQKTTETKGSHTWIPRPSIRGIPEIMSCRDLSDTNMMVHMPHSTTIVACTPKGYLKAMLPVITAYTLHQDKSSPK